jgi:2-oxo-4-hydroxy-4-carboxy-5-ureidoimidazoline decarboxylase
MTLSKLNSADSEQAQEALLRCCGSLRWADQMSRLRPFADESALQLAAENTWWSLSESDWLQAFAAHPKIGERKSSGQWSSQEQSGMNPASTKTVEFMSKLNSMYERKFGWIFIVCATGKTADEMQQALENRLTNIPMEEIRIAAGEQAKITRLRLEKLLAE